MFKNIISLGFFCSVAEDIERMGFRSKSYPFDWLITPWGSIEKQFEEEFENFLNEDFLSQQLENPSIYINKVQGHKFYHDFNRYISFDAQISSVRDKYKRRIERFNRDIKESTLFIRYIANQEELSYIESNFKNIEDRIKSYNIQNEIVYIANDTLFSNIVHLYLVPVDLDDTVCRRPFDYCPNLIGYIKKNYSENVRVENFDFYNKKIAKISEENKKNRRIYIKVYKKLKKKMNRTYVIKTRHSVKQEISLP